MADPTVGAAMVTAPKTMTPDVTVGEVRAAFRNDHLHMVLLAEAGLLVGTLVRDDLGGAGESDPALPLAVLAGRTVARAASLDEAKRVLLASDARRLAVVDDSGALAGLLCLKRHRAGFCSDRDVRSRAAG